MIAFRRLRSQDGTALTDAGPACANCRFFRNDPRSIEAAVPGLWTMSSGYAAVRADDGLCERHARYLAAASCCGEYQPQTLMRIEAF